MKRETWRKRQKKEQEGGRKKGKGEKERTNKY